MIWTELLLVVMKFRAHERRLYYSKLRCIPKNNERFTKIIVSTVCSADHIEHLMNTVIHVNDFQDLSTCADSHLAETNTQGPPTGRSLQLSVGSVWDKSYMLRNVEWSSQSCPGMIILISFVPAFELSILLPCGWQGATSLVGNIGRCLG